MVTDRQVRILMDEIRKGKSLADYQRNEPDVISIEKLSDNGLTDGHTFV